jgi:hypothetical protein
MSKPLKREQVAAAMRFYELALAPLCKSTPMPGTDRTPEQSASTPPPPTNSEPKDRP